LTKNVNLTTIINLEITPVKSNIHLGQHNWGIIVFENGCSFLELWCKFLTVTTPDTKHQHNT